MRPRLRLRPRPRLQLPNKRGLGVIYLDWNATAPLSPAARAAWLAAQDAAWGNPSSVHWVGQQARHAVDQAKASCARLLGCAAHELVVTSGGSEANALAIHGVLAAGGAVLTSAIEHSSVLRNAANHLHRTVAVDGDGRCSPAEVVAALDADVRLVSIQLANNEIGTVQDLAGIVRAVKGVRTDVLVHADCCQGAGKLAFDLRALGVDLASFTGHKFGAPKGVGLLYVRNGVKLAAQILGGRQQQDRRSGTEDAALLSAFAAALADAAAHCVAESSRQTALLDAAFARIAAACPAVRRLGHATDRLPNTLSLVHPGADGHQLTIRLDLEGIAVSPGSACMAARGEPSHVVAAVLAAQGLDPALARSALRVSIGPTTTAADLDAFVLAYARVVGQCRA